MKRISVVILLIFSCLILIMTLLTGCGSSDTGPGAVLLDKDVTVAGGGGSEEVSFSTGSVQTVRITLTSDSSMQPYGYLTRPNGEGEYSPGEGIAVNGVNTSEVTLDPAGEQTLIIYDSTNQGGKVNVHVEVL